MSAKARQGLPTVPTKASDESGLLLFLRGVRDALSELQFLSGFVSGLTDNQRSTLLSGLKRLAKVEKGQKAQASTLDEVQNNLSQAQDEIDALTAWKTQAQQELQTLITQYQTLSQDYQKLTTKYQELEQRVGALENP